jgi:hypothetical protein
MESAVERYCTASAADDLDGMLETLAPDVELVSPISGRMIFRGRRDLAVLLRAVNGSITQLRWEERVQDGKMHVVIGYGQVAGVQFTDAMVVELAADGGIQRIRPHLRPWLAVTIFALRLAPKLIRHPDVLSRALGAHRSRAA